VTDERTPSVLHEHLLFRNIGAITSEPKHIKRRDTGIPFVPLLHKISECRFVASPARDDIGIFVHLIRRQLKRFCNAPHVARAQGAAALAVAGHQLRWPPVGRNLLHVTRSIGT
jgi:hypothetical protein